MLSDPAAAAWTAAGEPSAAAEVSGRCGRCGFSGRAVPSRSVVSVKFTGFADWPFGDEWLCPACAWAYSRPPAKQPALHITSAATVEFSDRAALAGILRVGVLPADEAVVLPTTRHRHVLASAQWGHLAVDGLVIGWDDSSAARLESLIWLRTAGATWVQLQRPVPPLELLASQPGALWPRVLDEWSSLGRWRAIPPLWAAAKILTNDYAGRAAESMLVPGSVR